MMLIGLQINYMPSKSPIIIPSRRVVIILSDLQLMMIIINIQGQITNCPHKNVRLAGENEFWRATNHIASALLLIGRSDPEALLKLDMIY